MIILVYDTWLYDDKKKSDSMSETGQNSVTQGQVRQNKVWLKWVKGFDNFSFNLSSIGKKQDNVHVTVLIKKSLKCNLYNPFSFLQLLLFENINSW